MDDFRSPRSPGLLARWMRRAWLAVGVVASIVALATLAAVFARPYTHRLGGDELAHVAWARQGVRAFVAAHGRLPRSSEFADWTRRSDLSEGTRFDGLGFDVDPRCARRGTDFYLSFWTGEAWVVWRSWQPDPDVAEIAGSIRAAAAEVTAAAGLAVVAGLAFKGSRCR